MPVARNSDSQGSFDSWAAFGDYLAGSLGGGWQVFESVPQIANVVNNACTLDFSLYSSWVVNLTASASVSISLLNVNNAQPCRVITVQPASGIGTVTWAIPTLRWSGGTAGQATGTSSIIDVFVFYTPFPGTILAGTAMPNC